jgi:DNA-binding CsgD family transcriptional regulator
MKRAASAPFAVGAGFVLAFCAMVALARPIEDLDALIRFFALTTLVALGVMSALRMRELLAGRTPAPARDAFRLGWAIATSALYLLFFAIGLFAPRLWALFHLLGGILLLAPLATVKPVGSQSSPAPRQGQAAITANTAREAISPGYLGAASVPGAFGISARESEVLGLIAEGFTNQEIADRLFVSLTTVKSHVSHLFEKTGSRNRVELLKIAAESDFRRIGKSTGPGHSDSGSQP